MKQSLLLATWLALSVMAHAQVFPVETILDNGLQTKRVNFVFLSDATMAGR